jgi:putative phosphoesterase
MKICAITDIHGRTQFGAEFVHVLKAVDLTLIAGDITHFGDEHDARQILNAFKNLNSTILAVHGNCDQESVNKLLDTYGINLHGQSRVVGNTTFYGLGGSNTSPFNTYQESSDAQIKKVLDRFQKKDTRFHIVVSHPPPAKTKVDKVFLGRHVGSTAVRTFIEEFQPDLVVCGHIHEARGVDTIGKTIVINPGPFPQHYAVITVDETLEYEIF